MTSARARGESIENAAIQAKIIDANKWLAGSRSWNDTVFDIWIDDAVEGLEPIR